MKPAPFLYYAPRSLPEALALLAEHGDAKPLAGGQSLIPAMNFRLAQPAALVDLNAVNELTFVREERGELRIGALTRHRTLETHPLVARFAPLIAETMPHVAHPQIRTRGTVGGSLAHADPAAELPAAMTTLGARLRVVGPAGERWVPAGEFFTGLFATVLEPGELLAEIAVPAAPARTGWAFDEVARRHGDYALVGAAAMVTLTADGRCAEVRVTLLSVGEGPVVPAGVAALRGQVPTAGAVTAAAAAAAAEIDPPSDIHASAAYRRRLARVLVERTVTRALSRAQA